MKREYKSKRNELTMKEENGFQGMEKIFKSYKE